MLVVILTLTLQVPKLWAVKPDPLLFPFSVLDDTDEIYTEDSFTVTGVGSAKVVKDKKLPVMEGEDLRRFFVIKFPQLKEGEYMLVLTVTDKGNIKVRKEFRIVVTKVKNVKKVNS